MDYDTWIRNLFHDCTQPQNRNLNALQAVGLIAASAQADPDFQLARVEDLRENLEMGWRFAAEGREDAQPPNLFYLENCGTVANWLSKLMITGFRGSYETREEQRIGRNTREPNQIQWLLEGRARDKHHLLRIDSGPLGHSYVLYLPPTDNGGGNYHYYLYQANEAVAFPMFDLGTWLNGGRSRIQGDPVEHVKNLKRLNGFIFTATRDWVVHTFTTLDTPNNRLRIGSGGWYTDPNDGVQRRLPNGETPFARRKHTFTLAVIDQQQARARIQRMYQDGGVAFQADRFPDVD